jgi:hypothetical protein
LACFFFDDFMAILMVILILQGVVPNERSSRGAIVYLAVHGISHGMVGMGWLDLEEKVDTFAGVASLAVVLIVGPVGLYNTMITAKHFPFSVRQDSGIGHGCGGGIAVSLDLCREAAIWNICSILYQCSHLTLQIFAKSAAYWT